MALEIASTPDKYPTEDMYGAMFKVIVGEEDAASDSPDDSHSFTLHVGVASFYSGFFASALKKDTFREGNERVIRLPEQSFSGFRKFVAFLNMRERYKAAPGDYRTLIEIYAMADRYLSPLLANIAMDLLIEKCMSEHWIPAPDFGLIYENTSESSPLREMVTTLAALCCSTPTIKVDIIAEIKAVGSEHEGDIFADILLARCATEQLTHGMSEENEMTGMMATFDHCKFHVHRDGEQCLEGRNTTSETVSG